MIIYYNPHIDDFLSIPPHYSFAKRRPLKKYGYIFNETIKNGGKINIFVDYTSSAFLPDKYFLRLPFFIRKIVVSLEIKKWLKENKIGNYVNFIDIDNDNVEDKLLFFFARKRAIGRFDLRINNINKFKGALVHLSHYFGYTREIASNLKKIKNLTLCGDSDITKNAFFKKHFFWNEKPFCIIKFSIENRFANKKQFSERNSIAVATGSFHDLRTESSLVVQDYVDFFNEYSLHPVRKMLFENKNKLKDLVNVQVSQYNIASKTASKFKIFQILAARQKKYFGINIVETYNDYQYAVVGEELAGFPGIGAFEAMACGCVLIAQTSFYDGLGMEENKHYIAYDGSLPDLIEKITWLREHPDLSRVISEAGQKYIGEMYDEQVYQLFKDRLTSLCH